MAQSTGAAAGADLAAIDFNKELFSRLKPLLQSVPLLLATTVYADYQTGLDAYQAGDYEKAMTEWKEEVNRPRVPTNLAVYREALYAIGMLHWQGEGVPQDYTVAAVWLKQAADINHAGAQNKLGYLHITGQGVPQNYQQARHWLEMAAAQGDPDAVHNLDLMFQRGLLAEADAAAGEAPPDERPESEPEPPPRPGEASSTAPATSVPQPASPAPETPAEVRQEPAVAGAEWILAQDPEHYTIQVIALRTIDNLNTFIAGHPDWGPFAIYTPAGNVRPLWVLVQGAYPDLETARAAAAAFPPGLQKREKMLIRKFGPVQDMLR